MPEPTPSTDPAKPPPGPPQPVGSEAETLAPAAPPSDWATLPPDPGAPAPAATDGMAIPGYEILATLGRGGMGVVYKARQTKLGRIVALKMILSGAHAGEADLARFRTEAEAIARLQHPNIVQIHEVGEQGGMPYFSLEFCAGGSLEKKLGGTPLPPGEAAALVEALARAMQAAHEKGVIHRDLKPANVLLAEDGTPKITDFGLAKKLDEAGQTHSGAIMGTPSYMAPEQAAGKSADIGSLADVYALGAILYECLTGRPPFKAATALDTIMQLVSDEPVPPTQLQRTTPRDLETICLKCLQKEPGKRYMLARELADDLRRFLSSEPIRARRVGQAERVAKWVVRNPVVAALLAAVVLSVLGGASGIVIKYLDAKEQEAIARRKAKEAEDALGERDVALQQARTDAEAARQAKAIAEERKTLAEQRDREAQYQLAISNVLLAQAAWDDHHAVVARQRLAAVPPDLRRWEWHYLTRWYQGGIFALHGHTNTVTSVAFSPDGAQLATGSIDNSARLWDARTGRFLLEFKGHAGGVTGVAFSPDGMRLATASGDKTARVWDARTGRQLQEFGGHAGGVNGVAFSPDGTRLATVSWDGTARLWEVGTGQLLREYKGHSGGVTGVAFGQDGTRLATVSWDGTARLWEVGTGKQILRCKTDTEQLLTGVAFSPDGARLATASWEGTARLWDARTGRQLQEYGGDIQTLGVTSVAFGPDGSRLATGSRDQVARLWDARSGALLREYKGHAGAVTGVAFGPDGMRLATASGDKTARLWDAQSGQPVLSCKGHARPVTSLAFSPDGARLATGSEDQTARLWETRSGQLLGEFKGHGGAVTGVAFGPDGMRLATASDDKTARVWDARTGRQLREYKGHTLGVTGVAFSPDGTRLATASRDGTARLWDARSGQFLREYKGHAGGVTGVAFGQEGTRLVTTSEDTTARLWDATTGEELLRYEGHLGVVKGAAFSPDGARLATASFDNTARLWDARTGQQLQEYKGHTLGVTGVAFSPDGARLATVSYDQTMRLWDARTGQQLLVCKCYTDSVRCVAFNPDGTWLATGWDWASLLWDARPLPLPPAEELAYRLWATRPEPDWHEEQFKQIRGSDHFAAAFHLDRLLAYSPARRADLLRQRTAFLEATLKQDAQNVAARLLLARTAWHSPALGPKDAAPLLPPADDKGLLQRRTRAGLLLRQQKPDEAVAALESALKDRSDDRPPAEELLLAWAYLDTKQADKAKELWTKATAWLDRGQEAVRAANAVTAMPVGALPGMAALFPPPADPRYNPFDWETWYEIDVLRRELSPRFAPNKP
jgi:WD40 repeat protein/tRNA A-37 threonylcarbamoyl transferase component Bud32